MTTEKPPSIPEAELQELCDRIAGTEASLLHGFSNASPGQHTHLETKLKRIQNIGVLYELIGFIRRALKALKESAEIHNWIPRGNIERVVWACCNQRYEKHDLEYIFYEDGDINGLLVLHLGTKSQTSLFSRICALPTDMITELAKQCKEEEINPVVPDWIKNYDRSKTEFDPGEDLPRLYRWAKVKEDRLSSSSVPRKRGRSGIHTTPQAGSDMQMSSTKTETPHLSVGNLPLHSDSKPSTDTVLPSRGLPPPAAQQRQQHSTALMPHFSANSPIVDMSSMQPMSGVTSASAGSDFMDEFVNWDWTSNLYSFNPQSL